MFPRQSMIVFLSNFARDIGLKEYLALPAAELFLERNKESLDLFYSFHKGNCENCVWNYNTCDFFYPKEVVGATKLEVLKLSINSVFNGSIRVCPVRKLKETLSETDDKITFT